MSHRIDITDALKEYVNRSDNKLLYLIEAGDVLENVKVYQLQPQTDIYSKKAHAMVHFGIPVVFNQEMTGDLVPLWTKQIIIEYRGESISLALVELISKTNEEAVPYQELLMDGKRVGTSDFEGTYFTTHDLADVLDIEHEKAEIFWTLMEEDFDVFAFGEFSHLT